MASTQRESLFCDKELQHVICRSLFEQKQSSTHCDVIMKVCGHDIFAHSNVLAAASPYFSAFLSQDLPRQFSQRSPQIIEIQIDGSEPSFLYEEAVSSVINFIYTGKMTVRENNIVQICEIARIMQMNQLVKFCERFIAGSTEDDVEETEEHLIKNVTTVGTDPIKQLSVHEILSQQKVHGQKGQNLHVVDPTFQAKVKANQLVSRAVQVFPYLLPEVVTNTRTKIDQATSTDSRYFETLKIPKQALNKRKSKPCTERTVMLEVFQDPIDDADFVDEEEIEEVEMDEHEINEDPTSPEVSDQDQANENGMDVSQSPSSLACRRSRRSVKPTTKVQEMNALRDLHKTTPQKRKREEEPAEPSDLNINKEYVNKDDDDEDEDDDEPQEGMDETIAKEEAAKRLLSLAEGIVSQQVEPQDQLEAEYEEVHPAEDYDPLDECQYDEVLGVIDMSEEYAKQKRRIGVKPKKKKPTNMIQIGPHKYQCETCCFSTNRVREMSAHIKLHKLEQNTCYYCEAKFDNKNVLTQHMDKHKGPNPFFCHVCNQRFRSRTLLNMHLPKHSEDKPFICEICSNGFKWKHALKCHMVTHTNKKEHLCDICGYATAHKSQLKAHHKVHTGDTYKCQVLGCSFESTKMQNMKYHTLTHTKEKPHQCDVCGQNFSLVKNLRRHMLLHTSDKKVSCENCSFTSTRADKLKEHMLKVHGQGTPPERRMLVHDMVVQNQCFSILSAIEEVDETRVQHPEIQVKIEHHPKLEPIEEDATLTIATHEDLCHMSQITHITAHDQKIESVAENTLIEIVQDGVPIHILPSQSILIAPSDSNGHTLIPEGQLAEVVHLTAVPGTDLIMECPDQHEAHMGNIVTSSASLAQVTMLTDVSEECLVQAIPEDMVDMDTGDKQEMEYSELTEVPISIVVEQTDAE